MSEPFIQANTNGRLHPANEPSITPLSRGFLYGDAIYEVWRTHHGVIFAWEEHYARLESSARSLHMALPFTSGQMLAEIQRTVAAFRAAAAFAGDVYIRLQCTRGAGPIGLDIALAERPEFVVLVQRCPVVSPIHLREGYKLSVASDLRRNPARSLNPAWKTGNYLNNLLGLREARARGADEVVMLNYEGELTEGAVVNLAFVQEGTVITPPLSAGILAGITRQLLLEKIAPAAGVPAREGTLHPRDLAAMSECFLLGTTRNIAAVGAIDDLRFRLGPDTTTARLLQSFDSFVRNYAAAHPELAV